jgi:hypothetical protein
MVCNFPGKARFQRLVAFITIALFIATVSRAQVPERSALLTQIPPDSGHSANVEKINANLSSMNSAGYKSAGRAFLYSLILPGLGEAYTGHDNYTKFFLTVEATGWGIYLLNNMQVVSGTEDYKNYAVDHAGLDRAGKDAQYWINVGKYNTIYDYNEQRRRERDVSGIYSENEQNFWRWDSYNNRLYYDWKRIQTRELERKQVYIIGGLVLNHLLSAINALRLARIYNKHSGSMSWDFQLSVDPYHQTALLNLHKTF